MFSISTGHKFDGLARCAGAERGALHSTKRDARGNRLHSWLFLPFQTLIPPLSNQYLCKISFNTCSNIHSSYESVLIHRKKIKFNCLHHCQIITEPGTHPTNQRITSKLDSFGLLSMTRNAIALSRSIVLYWNVQLARSLKKGASARRGRRLLPSGLKKTKALLKQVTGNGALGACQDIV